MWIFVFNHTQNGTRLLLLILMHHAGAKYFLNSCFCKLGRSYIMEDRNSLEYGSIV